MGAVVKRQNSMASYGNNTKLPDNKCLLTSKRFSITLFRFKYRELWFEINVLTQGLAENKERFRVLVS